MCTYDGVQCECEVLRVRWKEHPHLCSSRCSTASRRPSVAAYPARSSRRRYPKLQRGTSQTMFGKERSTRREGKKVFRTPKLIAGRVKVERMDEGVFLPVIAVDDLLRHPRLEMRHSQRSVVRRGIDLQRRRCDQSRSREREVFNHHPSLRDDPATDRTGLARTKLEERDRVGPVRFPVPPPPKARLDFHLSFVFFTVVPNRVLRRARFRFDGSPCVGAVPQADVTRLVARKDLKQGEGEVGSVSRPRRHRANQPLMMGSRGLGSGRGGRPSSRFVPE